MKNKTVFTAIVKQETKPSPMLKSSVVSTHLSTSACHCLQYLNTNTISCFCWTDWCCGSSCDDSLLWTQHIISSPHEAVFRMCWQIVVFYTSSQQIWSNIHSSESCYWSPDSCKSNNRSTFSSGFGLHHLLREISGSLAARVANFKSYPELITDKINNQLINSLL